MLILLVKYWLFSSICLGITKEQIFLLLQTFIFTNPFLCSVSFITLSNCYGLKRQCCLGFYNLNFTTPLLWLSSDTRSIKHLNLLHVVTSRYIDKTLVFFSYICLDCLSNSTVINYRLICLHGRTFLLVTQLPTITIQVYAQLQITAQLTLFSTGNVIAVVVASTTTLMNAATCTTTTIFTTALSRVWRLHRWCLSTLTTGSLFCSHWKMHICVKYFGSHTDILACMKGVATNLGVSVGPNLLIMSRHRKITALLLEFPSPTDQELP